MLMPQAGGCARLITGIPVDITVDEVQRVVRASSVLTCIAMFTSNSFDSRYHKPVSTATLDRPPTCTPLGPPFPFLTISVWIATGWRWSKRRISASMDCDY
jgi:hypothetical protein